MSATGFVAAARQPDARACKRKLVYLADPGCEYPLMGGPVMLAIALRGGGPCPLDRRLGREP